MTGQDIHKNAFKEEAYELLSELEQSLMELEEHPDDQDLVSRVFRAMHTIKGSGAMFGFDAISRFTHDVETTFDLVRTGKMAVSKTLIDLTLAARDQIKMMLENEVGTAEDEAETRLEIIARFKELLGQSTEVAEPDLNQPQKPSAQSLKTLDVHTARGEEIYRIRFKPPADIFLRGINPLVLINDLKTLGKTTIIAQPTDLPLLDALDPELCYYKWDVILTTEKKLNDIRDVFIFVEEDSELLIEPILLDEEECESGCKKIGEILIERGELRKEDLDAVLGRKKLLGEELVELGLVSEEKVLIALAEQQHMREVQEKKTRESGSSIRVASDKLDKLVNLIGELVTIQAHMSQTAAESNDAKLIAIAEGFERLTAELRDNTMNIRMLPIGTTFSKFKRLVRDLSTELGKEIDIETEGGDTEIDKTVIEKLNDPLVHIIRNSIDHGIEKPDIRISSGKKRSGTIRLTASHSGANVVIKIIDDGAGLKKDAIRKKAIEKGLISGDREMSEKELFGMIMNPGFSTASTVTSVSGRGVGMDVVKQAIEALKGTIEISSREGSGTIITLTIPLTLAIIDGFLVKVAGEFFVIPLSEVAECMELTRRDIAAMHGRNIVNIRGGVVPYIRLREVFSVNGGRPDIEHLVIADTEQGRIGLVADQIIGEHQTVIKPLGTVYRDVNGVSGATILGNGSVALILDVRALAREAEQESPVIGNPLHN